MSDSLFRFRNLCSMIQEPFVRGLLEEWAIKNVRTYQVEARIDTEAINHGQMEYQQKRTLEQLIRGVVEECQIIEKREWLQGDYSFGKIVTRKINILGDPDDK